MKRRNPEEPSWIETIESIMEAYGGEVELETIYKKAYIYRKNMPFNFRASIRGTLSRNRNIFMCSGKGKWRLRKKPKH